MRLENCVQPVLFSSGFDDNSYIFQKSLYFILGYAVAACQLSINKRILIDSV